MALPDTISTAKIASVHAISPARIAATDDDHLPSLLSMVVEGFPPFQQSKYTQEAEKLLKQYVERHYDIVSLDSYCSLGLSFASYVHARVISPERLVLMALQYGLAFLLDDFFFDCPDKFVHDKHGIDCSVRASPQKIKEYFDHLNLVFRQRQPPVTLMETMIGELGRDILEMSNPEWFKTFADCVDECYQTCITSHDAIVEGHNSCFQDLESYTAMRGGNAGGKFTQLLLEFGNHVYVPSALRSDPFMQEVTATASLHIGFSNDVFSYHKESLQEGNPRNLISVLMNCEGKSFVQTVHRAIGLVNKYARAILDSESKAPNPVLLRHLHDIKELVAGHVYYSYMEKRYRHPDSVLPELRDTITIWKALPQAGAAVV